MYRIELGRKVRDQISGFEGIAVAAHEYLNGCRRISVQRPIDKDGKLPESECFDEMTLEYVGTSPALTGDNTTGGPDKYPDPGRPM